MIEQIVIVNYVVKKEYCQCCDQRLPEAKSSKPLTFEFDRESTLEWTNWDEAVKYYPEDLDRMVYDYVYSTIRFHAVSSYDRVAIEESELEKVKDFIFNVVVK